MIFFQECVDGDDQCVQLRPYESIYDDLESLSNSWNKVLMGKKVAYSGGASYAIYGFIPQSKQVLELSPIMLMKAQKNEVDYKLGPRIESTVMPFILDFMAKKCSLFTAK